MKTVYRIYQANLSGRGECSRAEVATSKAAAVALARRKGMCGPVLRVEAGAKVAS